jgi:hypothetical protein
MRVEEPLEGSGRGCGSLRQTCECAEAEEEWAVILPLSNASGPTGVLPFSPTGHWETLEGAGVGPVLHGALISPQSCKPLCEERIPRCIPFYSDAPIAGPYLLTRCLGRYIFPLLSE